MAHTDDDTVVAEAIFDLLEANKATLLLDDVLYGNHNNIPRASGAVVTALGNTRTLAGVSAPGGRTENTLNVEIDLHWSKVGDEATERRAADARGTALSKKLHEDTTLGGIVIHGFVVTIHRGETIMADNSMFRSVRLMYSATTKTYLSPPAAP
jgi:hypothetical protein